MIRSLVLFPQRAGSSALGAALLFASATVVTAAESASVRFQQAFLFAADGTRTPIEHFPSVELQPTPEPTTAFGLECEASGLRYPVSSAIFIPSFTRKARPAETPSAAVDVYLMAGETPYALADVRAKGHFAGSSIVAFRSPRATARLNLADALNHVKPASRFSLVLVPVGVPGINPPFALHTAPSALSVFSRSGDQAKELSALMQPLWRGTQTTEESVIFYAENEGDVPQTRLLHRPKRIERIFSFATGRDYSEGKDWSVDADGRLRALPGSTLPIGRSESLYPQKMEADFKYRTTRDKRNLLISETWSYPLTVQVNYTHDDDWSGLVPTAATASLARTFRKLERSEPVTIVFIGDSIASSGRGSATVMVPPYGPTWPELFVAKLRERFGGPIVAKNRALGGTTSTWGASNAACAIAPARPDLVVIAFGMNDQRKTSPEKFRANLEAMVNQTRALNPAVDFIFVSSMISSPAVNDKRALVEYREEMRKFGSTGFAIADVTAISRYLVQTKPFIDIAVNNFNHPNDYLLRWYAQVAAELLLGDGAP